MCLIIKKTIVEEREELIPDLPIPPFQTDNDMEDTDILEYNNNLLENIEDYILDDDHSNYTDEITEDVWLNMVWNDLGEDDEISVPIVQTDFDVPELETNDYENMNKSIDDVSIEIIGEYNYVNDSNDNEIIEIVDNYSFSHLYTAPVENDDDKEGSVILMRSFMIHNDDIDDYGNEIYNDLDDESEISESDDNNYDVDECPLFQFSRIQKLFNLCVKFQMPKARSSDDWRLDIANLMTEGMVSKKIRKT